jgi:hypothetical protein
MLPNQHEGYNPSNTTNSNFECFYYPCSSQLYPSTGRSQTITPSHHITVRGNNLKAARVEASHTNIGLPTPRSSLDSPKNLPSSDHSDLHAPKAILSPHSTMDQNNPVSSKDVADHANINLPTPRQSLDSTSKFNQPLSFDSVLSRLKPILDGTARMNGERKVTVVGVSSDIVDKLRAKSEASELPGWENIRYVGFSSFKLTFGKCNDITGSISQGTGSLYTTPPLDMKLCLLFSFPLTPKTPMATLYSLLMQTQTALFACVALQMWR